MNDGIHAQSLHTRRSHFLAGLCCDMSAGLGRPEAGVPKDPIKWMTSIIYSKQDGPKLLHPQNVKKLHGLQVATRMSALRASTHTSHMADNYLLDSPVLQQA